MRKQSTGEPYALIAPVRFGGRGGESHSYPYPLRDHAYPVLLTLQPKCFRLILCPVHLVALCCQTEKSANRRVNLYLSSRVLLDHLFFCVLHVQQEADLLIACSL